MNGRWKNTINFADIWEKFDEGEIESYESAKLVAERLKHKRFIGINRRQNEQLQAIIEQFEAIHEEEGSTRDFNHVLADLYDWADVNKTCWIETTAHHPRGTA